jgi:hypothetical protein
MERDVDRLENNIKELDERWIVQLHLTEKIEVIKKTREEKIEKRMKRLRRELA